MAAGSVERPKKTKNTAANMSRSGDSIWVAWCATGPESAMPTRKAPDRGGHLQLGRDAGHEQGEAEHAEQQGLGVLRPR